MIHLQWAGKYLYVFIYCMFFGGHGSRGALARECVITFVLFCLKGHYVVLKWNSKLYYLEY